jgi:twitching motility protein PilT
MASLHTVSAVETVNRIVDVFPAAQQGQIRVQLADTLQGVACQTLFHDEKDGGMVPAVEILFPTPAIRRAIRDGETHLLAGMVETGKAIGMQTMDSAIAVLVAEGRITSASALAKAHNPERLAKAIA